MPIKEHCRKYIAITLAVIISLGLMPTSAKAEAGDDIAARGEVSLLSGELADYAWYDSNKTATQFAISSTPQLQGLADIVNGNHGTPFNFSGRTINLMADLDLSGYESWTPIGTNYNAFSGTFNGNSHTISGLTINAPSQEYVGLFGMLYGTVTNLYLSGVNIIGYQYVGGIAGQAFGNITHCAVTGGTVSGNGYTGGMAGSMNGSLTASFATCNIFGRDFSPFAAGGVAGRVDGGNVINCYSTGSVKPAAGVSGYFTGAGGIAGSVNSGSVQNCFATGEISATMNVGGITGSASGSYIAATLSNCAALNIRITGDPSTSSIGDPNVGRVAGRTSGSIQETNTLAFSGMLVVGSGSSNLNGTDKSSAEIKAEGFFTSNGFTLPTWNSQTEMLPILTGFPGGLQSGELPAHIGSPTPTEPQAFTGAPESGLVKLSWNTPGSIGASSITRYEVQKNNESWISVGMATTYTFSGLTNGTAYTFRVRAVNSYGNGAEASIQRMPVNSGHMAAIAGNQTVLLNWVTPAALISKISFYQVRYNGISWRTPDEDFAHTFFGLANGVTYTFDVQAVGQDGTFVGVLFSDSVQATPIGIPLEPTNLTAASGNGQIALSWDAPYSDGGSTITRYEVSQDNGQSWVSVGTATTHTFAGLINATTYTLQVRAVNGIGTGGAAGISATPRQPPVIISGNSQNYTYGSGGSFTVSASGTPPFTYSLSGQPDGVSINASTGVITVEKTVPADTYPISITASNGSLPNSVQSFSLTITRLTPQLSDLQYTAPANRTYDGNNTGIGSVTDKNALGLSCTVYYQGAAGTVYPKSQTAPKNTGDYDVIAGIAGSANINAVDLPLGSYRILPKSITITPVAGQSKIYAQPDPLLQYNLSSALASGDLLSGALARAAGENAGTYGINLGTMTAGSNYTLSLSGTVSFAIYPKADATFTIADISPVTYTGSAITPEPQVKDSEKILTKNVDFTYDYNSNISVGTNARVSIIGTGNYAGSTGFKTFTIEKAAPSVTLTANPAFTQMRPCSIELSAALPANATGMLIFRANSIVIGEITLPSKTILFTPTGADNTYSFTVEYSGDGNYESAISMPLNYSFTKSDQAALAVSNGTVDFGSSLDLSALAGGGSGTGAFDFTVTDGPATLDGTILRPTGSEEITVCVTKAADNDYHAKSASFKVMVNPRVITFTVEPVAMQTHTGSAITPRPEVKDADKVLTENVHFIYDYSSNTDPSISAAVQVIGIGGYAGSSGSTVFTIGGAVPGIRTLPAVSDKVYAGTPLSKIELTGGEATVSGHFEWTDPTAKAVRGLNTFKIRFVPDDSVLYVPIESTGITFSAVNRPDNARLPAARLNQPAAGSVAATAEVRGGHATLTIFDSMVSGALQKALTDAKATGNTNGISLEISVAAADASSFAISMERNALNRLVDAGVQSFRIVSLPVNISFDAEALKQIRSQSSDTITITLRPVMVRGLRNAYDVSVNSIKAGKTVNITSLGTGFTTLGISAVPAQNEFGGYLCGVYVGANKQLTRIEDSVYDSTSKRVIFSANHFSIYGVGYTATSTEFADIATHWAKGSIEYAVGRGLLAGTSKTLFSPDTAITRAELITALGKLARADVSGYKTSSFTDVKPGSAYQPYIEWAYRNGIAQGAENGVFGPSRAVTREEIALIIANYATATSHTLPVARKVVTLSDYSRIGSTYKASVSAILQSGVMAGQDNLFNPTADATRAQVCAMLYRYVKLMIDPLTAQGWAQDDDGQYFYYRNGNALRGRQSVDGTLYFFSSSGVLRTGWVQDRNDWYYFVGNNRIIGWQDILGNRDSKRYYFTSDGIRVAGKWMQIDGKWYYFNSDGSLAKSTVIGGYAVDADGVRKPR